MYGITAKTRKVMHYFKGQRKIVKISFHETEIQILLRHLTFPILAMKAQILLEIVSFHFLACNNGINIVPVS